MNLTPTSKVSIRELVVLQVRPVSLCLSVVVLCASCALGPDFQLPEGPGGISWKQGKAAPESILPDEWWRSFNDAQLNQLVTRALGSNHDLAIARARVDTSRALIGVDRARLFPRLDLSGSAGINRNSQDAIGANLPSGLTIDLDNQRYRSSLDVAYDLDLWGRNRRLVEASAAQAAAVEALLDAQRLGVAAEVARQYFVLRGLDAQEIVLKDTVESRKDELSIQDSRNAAGLTDALASTRARTEMELATNDLASVQRQRGAAEHALAVLCGVAPSSFSLPRRPSPQFLPKIRPGLPAQVIARRPDVRAAAQELRAANARIGVAEAAFYPNFNLIGSAGLESLKASDFLNWENRILSLGANVTSPLIDAGSNRANLQAARSRYEEALAKYRRSLLVALRDVEDALVDLRGLARSNAALERALISAGDTRRLSQERYEKGLSSYLEVVDADRTVLQIRLSLRQVEAQQRIGFTALAKALGGGWSGK